MSTRETSAEKTAPEAGLPEEFAAGGMPGATVSGLMGGLLSGAGSAISGLVSGAGKALSSLGSMLFKHREGVHAGGEADPEAIRSQLGTGQALDSSVQRRMQSAFGQDFAGVRVHTDAKARELSDGLNARAFTIGNDIAFGGDEYKPGTPVGDALIAHDLAHVVQQGAGHSSAPMNKAPGQSDQLEEDADLSAMGAVVSTLLLREFALPSTLPRDSQGSSGIGKQKLHRATGCDRGAGRFQKQ